MRRTILSFILVALSTLSQATVYYATGLVKGIYVTPGANTSFTIAGFSSAGSCPTNDGLVAIIFPDNSGG